MTLTWEAYGPLAVMLFLLITNINMIFASRKRNRLIKCVESQLETIQSTQYLCNTMLSEYKKNPNSDKIRHAFAQYKQSLEQMHKANLKIIK